MFQILQQSFLELVFVGLFTALLVLALIPLAHKISFVDKPHGRKTHENSVPVIGGICIFLACGLSSSIFGVLEDLNVRSLFFAASLFLLLGVLDDYFDIKANVKLLAQFMISFIFIANAGLQISNFDIPFGLAHFIDSGFIVFAFAMVAMVGLTNAFNMIDGCDGLAAGLASCAFAALFYFGSGHFSFQTKFFLLMLIVATLVFLIFNFSADSKRKVFLGDGGSLFLGFSVSGLLVRFAENNETYDSSIILWFAAVPVYDLGAVALRRLLLKRNIMHADRSHIHHYLISLGASPIQTTMILLITAIALLCFGVFLEADYPGLSLFAFIGLFTVYLSCRLFVRGIH